MKRTLRFLLLASGLSLTSLCDAAIVVSNWSPNEGANTLSFDISGTIADGTTIGALNSNNLYIGVPGTTNWITSPNLTRTFINLGGGSVDLKTDVGGAISNDLGDYIFLQADGVDWAAGSSVNASIVFNTLAGFDFNTMDSSSIIVSVGRADLTTIYPDSTYQVGAMESVPEPSTYAVLAGLTLVGTLFTRRRQVV